MKRLLFFALILISCNLAAKKIMFSVNMEAWLVDSAGVHVTGDFQDEAGFAADWDPGTTAMMQDVNDTNLWWVVLDLPANRHYEFKYVNGNQGYQQEFVPVESRVNYNFIDNRWIYLDSLSNDTFHLPAVRFSGNAPAGKNLIRFYVDMTNETAVSGNGVHLGNDINAWSTTDAYMYSFDGIAYEYLAYVDSGTSTAHEYKFLNGNGTGDYELLAGWCANANGYREIVAPRDTMLPVVCYTFCAACNTVGVQEMNNNSFTLLPNPASDYVTLNFQDDNTYTISVIDHTGREVAFVKSSGRTATVSTVDFADGVYFVRTMDAQGRAHAQKLIVE